MAKQVIDIHPGSGMTADQSNEHLRNWSDSKWEKVAKNNKGNNYNRSRAGLNFEIFNGKIVRLNESKISIPERIKANLDARGIIDPNNKKLKRPRRKGQVKRQYRTLANIIFGGSRDRMLELAFGNQEVNTVDKTINHSHIIRNKDIEEWALDVYNFACKQWGEENIVGFCVHLDETNPHIHCSVMPIADGKFNYDKLFNCHSKEGKALFKKYHDELAKINKKWGLERGEPVGITRAKHRSTEQYRYVLRNETQTLEDRKAQLERQIDDLEFDLANNHYSLDQVIGQYNIANKRVKGLTSMLEQLERKHTEAVSELDKLRVQGEARQEVLDKKLNELQRILDNIERKNVELEAASRKLELLTNKRTEMQEQLNDIGHKIAEAQDLYKGSLIEKANINLQRVAGTVLNEVLGEFDGIFARMTPQEAALFEGTIIEDLVNSAPEILKCATFLFMEMPLQATNFAESHGGGGGGGAGDDNWWKKKDDDEDDLAYARRCFFGAVQMIRPPQRRRGMKR